jgi:hypothetical protein
MIICLYAERMKYLREKQQMLQQKFDNFNVEIL